MKTNLKTRLKNGEVVLGMWNHISHPLVADITSRAGLDFLLIDFEHGAFNPQQIHAMVASCEVNHCAPLIRLPVAEEWMVLQALDQGVHGVMVSHVNSPEDVQKIIRFAKHYPLGARSFSPHTKSGGYSEDTNKTYAKQSNDFNLVSVVIEDKEGLKNLSQIVDHEALDLIYFGAYDLSQALGFSGEPRHKEVIKEIQKGIKICQKYQKATGGFVARNIDDVHWLKNMGMQFITYLVDAVILFENIQNLVTEFKKG